MPSPRKATGPIAAVEKIKGSEDLDAIKKAVDLLEQASHKAAEELYRSSAPTEPPPGNGGSGPTNGAAPEAKPQSGEVVDAEFRQA